MLDRGGVALMPELGYAPVNRYLPPRPRRIGDTTAHDDATQTDTETDAGSLTQRWLNRFLKR